MMPIPLFPADVLPIWSWFDLRVTGLVSPGYKDDRQDANLVPAKRLVVARSHQSPWEPPFIGGLVVPDPDH